MVLVRAPIIDYENPCYCPDPLPFHSDLHVDPRISPFPRKDSSAVLVPTRQGHEGVDARKYDQPGVSLSSIHALIYGHMRDDLSEKPVARVARHESGPARKRARYTNPENDTDQKSFMTPRAGWLNLNEPRSVKQERASPAPAEERKEQINGQPNECEKVPDNRIINVPLYDVVDAVTTQSLLLRLDYVFPGMGFREAVDSDEYIWSETGVQCRYERHQALVDLLGERGALGEYALPIFNDAEFRHLDLGPTMSGVNALNLPKGDVMRVFSQPGRFKYLRTLSFSGGRFRDDLDLVYIHQLHILANTGIGNEGVFHTVALKHNLRYLDLSGNPSINDDSIPALLYLENLQYLSLFGTGVLMPGLRKLAVATKTRKHVLDIRIPNMCLDYINSMHNRYLLYLAPPLILDPNIVCMLSKTALLRNLEAHATINMTISCTGSHEEMEERLWKILEQRKLDLAVREMVIPPEVPGGFE